ncbi:SLOG family protein [Duganella sp. CF458]|uniref:SLOG family protein n=1 Tax=Duganella sp. CF458 TaxID=1884368 RepID=UPI0014817CCD|nr:SLOG family protein [Duganella sp. CF458]
MRVLITGATTWHDDQAIRRELSALGRVGTVITGDTPGIDAVAISVARELGFEVVPMKKNRADYKAFPGEGWKGLNVRMLEMGVDLVLAFHADFDTPGCARGTRHAVELAQQSGIAVRVCRA